MGADVSHLSRAVSLAERSARTGGGPFGAIVVAAGGAAYGATNEVTRLNDPTAHAEVQAIRLAARAEGFDLSGATLYTSCQPCPMCFTAAAWARIDRVVYAASTEDASGAGFDDGPFWRAVQETGVAPFEVTQHELPTALRPFEAWQESTVKVAY